MLKKNDWNKSALFGAAGTDPYDFLMEKIVGTIMTKDIGTASVHKQMGCHFIATQKIVSITTAGTK